MPRIIDLVSDPKLKYQRYAEIQGIIGPDVDVHEIDPRNGDTALHYAVKHANLDLFDFLVSRGVNVNIANHDGVTPLQSALSKVVKVRASYLYSEEDRATSAMFLVANGASIDTLSRGEKMGLRDLIYDKGPTFSLTSVCPEFALSVDAYQKSSLQRGLPLLIEGGLKESIEHHREREQRLLSDKSRKDSFEEEIEYLKERLQRRPELVAKLAHLPAGLEWNKINPEETAKKLRIASGIESDQRVAAGGGGGPAQGAAAVPTSQVELLRQRELNKKDKGLQPGAPGGGR